MALTLICNIAKNIAILGSIMNINDNKSFYKWWVQAGAIGISAVFIYLNGLFHGLWLADQTKISFFIILIFVVASLTIGWLSKNKDNPQLYEDYGEYLWFTASAMVTLGLIGTVAGFLIMLGSAFQDIDITDVVKMQDSLADMALGMSTALTTTLVGLVCMLLTKLQLVILVKGYEVEPEG